ncbi:Type II secretion system (T2SS), protein M [Thiothrix caldifontis]|jgi:Type II secretory pathway, component PulM|uniref:Type II secretion system (T2SS), protein M n=1 Tax=Thiothrix caldifontis TaxID=525918 RepID=A0A1H3WMP6_9GAMM|nr:type II secretion system protein M [Thiothrix caldifontis]SDZ88230.1 Type II secretion system (T2SS), protein M [Thiothrix caldifontis]
MKAWWQNLAASERRLMSGGAILIGLTMLWLFVWKPLNTHHQLLQQDLVDAQAAHAEMQRQRAEILALRGAAPNAAVAASGSLHTSVIAALKQFQLDGTGTSSEEKNKNTVTLKLEAKPFDTLAQFLAAMETQHAANTTSMTLKPAGKPGTVDAQITLER